MPGCWGGDWVAKRNAQLDFLPSNLQPGPCVDSCQLDGRRNLSAGHCVPSQHLQGSILASQVSTECDIKE